MKNQKREKRNRQIGIIASLLSHILILLFFIFMVAWRAPDPPLPEIGIEINFGLSNVGNGEEEPNPNLHPSETKTENTPIDGGEEENLEEVPPESTEEEPTELLEEEILTPTNTQDSPDNVVEKKTEAPIQDVSKKKEIEEKSKENKKPPILYPNKKPGITGKGNNSTEPNKANQGDKSNTVGNQGDKDGQINARALYGKLGGGGGSSLQMSGWMWDFKPKPNDVSSESGKIIFQIVIDDKGIVVRVNTLESSISPSLQKIYRDEVMKLTFSKTSGTSISTTSTGIITFILKAK